MPENPASEDLTADGSLRWPEQVQRYRVWRRGVEAAEPFIIGQLLPPPLFSAPLRSLRVPPRLKKALAARGCAVVADVLALGHEGFLDTPGVGVRSLSALAAGLDDLVEQFGAFDSSPAWASVKGEHHGQPGATRRRPRQLGAADSSEVGGLVSSTLRSGVELALRSLKHRDALVFRRRLGWGCAPETLEDIGRELGVTRERTRQIERRALRDVEAQFNWRAALSARLSQLLDCREKPLYMDLLAAEDSWFDGFQGELELLQRLMAEGAPEFGCFAVDGRRVISRASYSRWRALNATLRETLSEQVSARLTRSEVDALAQAIIRSAGGSDLLEPAIRQLQEALHFTRDESGREYLAAVGDGARWAVAAVLKSAERPLHLSEIRERLFARGYFDLSDSYLRMVINKAGGELFGRSTFGVGAHLPLAPAAAEDALDEILQIMQWRPERQWHTAELAECLAEARPDFPEDMDKYAVNVLLKTATFARYLGRLVWILNDAPKQAYPDRLQVAEMMEAILRSAGSPLTSSELRRRIRAYRGVNTSCQFVPSECVFRLGWGRWGLRDRDFLLDPGQVTYGLDSLADLLARRDTALHFSELPSVLQEFGFYSTGEADEIIGFAQHDERFRFGRGQMIGLAAWPNMKRPSVGEAIAAVLEPATNPLSISEIEAAVTDLVGRSVSRVSLASRLAAMGFEYRPGEGWSVGEAPDEDLESVA